jgi:hypothetical protein
MVSVALLRADYQNMRSRKVKAQDDAQGFFCMAVVTHG